MTLEQQLHLAKKELSNIDGFKNKEEKVAQLNLVRSSLIGCWQENRDISEMEFMDFLNNSIENLEEYIKNNKKCNIENVRLELNKCLYSLKHSKILIIQKRYL